jgi:hypothetical protein
MISADPPTPDLMTSVIGLVGNVSCAMLFCGNEPIANRTPNKDKTKITLPLLNMIGFPFPFFMPESDRLIINPPVLQ